MSALPSSLPPEFLQQMNELLGTEAQDFLDSLHTIPAVSVSQHVLKIKKWKENIRGVKWNKRGVYLPERPVFTLDPSFHAGAYYVQEASSMIISHVYQQLNPLNRPLRILDLCAAPGGKSVLLANEMSEGSLLVCNEVIRSRYTVLRYNLDKWGIGGIVTTSHDSEDFGAFEDWFDFVLVDAPCSGEGMFRKDPEAVAEWSTRHVAHCAARQQRILAAAAKLVKPGGHLVYSTCTYNVLENDDNARWLIAQGGWELKQLSFEADWNITERNPGYQLYPHRVQGEGLYVCAFSKTDEHSPAKPKWPSASGKLMLPPKKFQGLSDRWLQDPTEQVVRIDPAGRWRSIPAVLMTDVEALATHLSRIEVGLVLGEVKGNDLIPAPALALHTAIRTDLPAVALSTPEALAYLRKENPPLPTSASGWTLIRYEELALGWIKGLGNRYNNYYPTEWRIRMKG